MTLRVQILKEKFSQSLGLPFKDLLPSSVIGQALKELKIEYKQRLFDPVVTLWAFVSQILDNHKSCHNAVSKVIAYLAGTGVEIPSTDTSAYCQGSRCQNNGAGLNKTDYLLCTTNHSQSLPHYF